ncbi:uncharacterized protein AB675_9639 [Cyphellophora attinorum]|uniref:Uncharacterized protein n=1 Tax=Cyphellophora attinorum TaxID=1664694 RepID=A0A0N0NPE4_9EURO|nr:uncharacterized protein AB675_9639 [Phialophora attinorum]KPI42628.1 hypothetical protein AB675_9639 [Phialophora attinorum]
MRLLEIILLLFALSSQSSAGPIAGAARLAKAAGQTALATRIAGATISKAFGIEASSCWYGGYVIVNAKLYYGANIVGAGVLGAGAIGGGAAGAAAVDNKNQAASKVLGGDLTDILTETGFYEVTDASISSAMVASISVASVASVASEASAKSRSEGRAAMSASLKSESQSKAKSSFSKMIHDAAYSASKSIESKYSEAKMSAASIKYSWSKRAPPATTAPSATVTGEDPSFSFIPPICGACKLTCIPFYSAKRPRRDRPTTPRHPRSHRLARRYKKYQPQEIPPGVPEYNFRMCQNDIILMGTQGRASR